MACGFGAFGKMPSLGDFFQLNAPAGFVPVWDDWLQQGILFGRDRLLRRWDECYLSAPIWRFSLAAGLAGKSKILGVLMPSIDRVGRQFPLTLMAAIGTNNSPLLDHFVAETLFSDLETLALNALDNDMSRDTLTDRLSDIPALDVQNPAIVCKYPNGLVLHHGNATSVLPDLAAQLAGERFVSPSVFSGETEAGPRLMIFENLPEPAQMLGLFDLNADVWVKNGAGIGAGAGTVV